MGVSVSAFDVGCYREVFEEGIKGINVIKVNKENGSSLIVDFFDSLDCIDFFSIISFP